MLTCPNCGIQNDYSRRKCFKCQTELAPAAPVEWSAAPEPAYDPKAAPPPNYVTRIALTEQQAQFTRAFSFGPACPVYFWSRATPSFALVSVLWALGQSAAWLAVKLDRSASLRLCGYAWTCFSIMSVVAILFVLTAGNRARQLRWKRLPWRDFDHFRKDETQWGLFGVACVAVYVLLWMNLVPNVAAIP